MTVPPLNMDGMMLAAHVTKVFGLIHRIAYAFVTPDLQIQRTSSNFAAALATGGNSCKGRPLIEVLWEFVGVEDSLQSILHGKLPYLAFERINRQALDGRTTYLDITVTMLNTPELGKGLLVILEDVTHTAEVEQRLTQNRNELALAREQLTQANIELQRLSRQKTLFLSMAVHDLRTPLTVIRAYGDLLLRALPPDSPRKVLDYANLINSQTSHMDWLIDDFLDLDQIEQGILSLRLEETDLNKLILKVADLVRYLVERRQLNLELKLAAEPMLMLLDANRIQQVIYNLLSNAIKYTLKGGVIVVENFWEEGTAVLRITDSGIGMAPEDQARAFQLYYQGDGEEKTRTRGKGLGLYIVKMLVEAHGGHVTLESKQQEGSSFTVYLPQTP